MQSLGWYARRLRSMTAAEIAWRIGSVALRYAVLIGPSAPTPRPRTQVLLEDWPRTAPGDQTDFLAIAGRLADGEVLFFGGPIALQKHGSLPDWNRDPISGIRAPMSLGTAIDYRAEEIVGNARNIWEINRHHHLVVLGEAWRHTSDERYRMAAQASVSSWLAECPFPAGINWSSALENGIRLINWYLASRLLTWWRLGDEPVPGMLESIYRQSQFIWQHQSRYSSANNHLIGEMAGLYVAARTWPCWPESDAWGRQAKSLLEREIELQFHADGVGREHAIHYQIFAIQFLVIAGLVGELRGDFFSPGYWTGIDRAISFLRSIEDASGRLPSIGDSDDGMVFTTCPWAHSQGARTLIGLTDAWRSEGDHPSTTTSDASWLLAGFPRPSAFPAGPGRKARAFRDGGYYILGSRPGEEDETQLVFDAASLGYLAIAAHGHADCLSFTLTLAGRPFLVDPGTYNYHTEPKWRKYFRGTRAHNTLTLDGEDQSESGGPFLWLRKAVPHVKYVDLDGKRQRIRASHDGYRRLSAPALVEREIDLHAAARHLVVEDTVASRGRHVVERHWHFAPGCTISATSGNTYRAELGGITLEITEAADVECRLLQASADPIGGWYSPRFGVLEPSTSLVARWFSSSAPKIATFNWSGEPFELTRHV